MSDYNKIRELLLLCKHINNTKDSRITVKPCITVDQSLESFLLENLDFYKSYGSVTKFYGFDIKEYKELNNV